MRIFSQPGAMPAFRLSLTLLKISKDNDRVRRLGVDKAALSRMIALVRRVPSPLIEAIGPAPSFGRQRWAEIADMVEERAKRMRALKHVEDADFLAARSDARFQIIFDSPQDQQRQ
ncbi:hypothetical protein CQA78_30120 [Klebsiella pneumoniae]|nr:hypothetical protein CQA78_30120 [Klebsiella pneumoniae]